MVLERISLCVGRQFYLSEVVGEHRFVLEISAVFMLALWEEQFTNQCGACIWAASSFAMLLGEAIWLSEVAHLVPYPDHLYHDCQGQVHPEKVCWIR